MNKYENIHKTKARTLAAVLFMFVVVLGAISLGMLTMVPTARAVDGVPAVDLNRQPTNTDPGAAPEGAFKLMICDGPPGINHWNPAINDFDLSTNNDGSYKYGGKPGFIPCNFKGLMIQVQFLINAMIVLGVLAALIGFTYAGFLYVKGTEGDRKKAKEIFPKIVWGFIIMLTAWFVVYQILQWLTGSSAYLQGMVS